MKHIMKYKPTLAESQTEEKHSKDGDLSSELSSYLKILKQANRNRILKPNDPEIFQTIVTSLQSIANIYKNEAEEIYDDYNEKLAIQLSQLPIEQELEEDIPTKITISKHISNAVKLCNAALTINREHLLPNSPDNSQYEDNNQKLVNELQELEQFFVRNVIGVEQKEDEIVPVTRDEKGLLASKTTLEEIRRAAEEKMKKLDEWIIKKFPEIDKLSEEIKKLEKQQEESELSDEADLELAIKMSLETEEEENKRNEEKHNNKEPELFIQELEQKKEKLKEEFYQERAYEVKRISNKINKSLLILKTTLITIY